MHQKVRKAWNAFQIYANAKQGIRRVDHHLEAMTGGYMTGAGTVEAVKDLAQNGPSRDDYENVAWKVANVGYRQARSAYDEHLRQSKKKK